MHNFVYYYVYMHCADMRYRPVLFPPQKASHKVESLAFFDI